MKQIGVIFSGCGVYDGTEIQEAVLTLLAIDRAGAKAVCFAPDKPQHHVINHLKGEESDGEARNVLVESARICRGDIAPLSEADADKLDALILPGGYGAAKNLCDFAFKGADCSVLPELAALIKAVHAAGKPIGFLCIAPAIAARVLGEAGVAITIGNDADTAKALEAMGAKHVICSVDQYHCDSGNQVLSTPAYMLGPRIGDVAQGIDALVGRVLDLCS
jgi:enhancing lycopene biosynthesis protein 2